MKNSFFNWSTTVFVFAIIVIVIGLAGALILRLGIYENNGNALVAIGEVMILLAFILAVMFAFVIIVSWKRENWRDHLRAHILLSEQALKFRYDLQTSWMWNMGNGFSKSHYL
jgi:amino acid transporter